MQRAAVVEDRVEHPVQVEQMEHLERAVQVERLERLD